MRIHADPDSVPQHCFIGFTYHSVSEDAWDWTRDCYSELNYPLGDSSTTSNFFWTTTVVLNNQNSFSASSLVFRRRFSCDLFLDKVLYIYKNLNTCSPYLIGHKEGQDRGWRVDPTGSRSPADPSSPLHQWVFHFLVKHPVAWDFCLLSILPIFVSVTLFEHFLSGFLTSNKLCCIF